MGRVLFGAGLILILVSSLTAADGHSPMLPRPRKVQYRTGTLALRGLAIHLASNARAEDRFTARELAASLAKTAGMSIPVSNGGAAAGAGIALRRTGAVDPLPTPGESTGPDSREAFTIRVTPTGAEIQGRSSAALFYGAQTLLQLVEGAGAKASLPEVEIGDWPSLPYRGVMVDTSHGPLPTEAEVKRHIDFLARWKNNQYYLYSENSIELEGYPVPNPDAQFKQDEIRRIVAYARERHIDVVRCMELYGHLHDLFRAERFAGLSLLPHGVEFNPRNPQGAVLLRNWVEQLTALFPSPFFHIGFDETREAPVVANPEQATAATLYMEQFKLVSGLVRQRGRTLLVWSDMFSRYQDLIPQIPPGTIVVPWGYDRTVEQFYWRSFADSKLPRIVATGVSIWDQVSPNFERSFDNIDIYLSTCRPHGISGLINTLWTDDIAVLLKPAFPGLAYGAISAWQAEPVNRGTFFAEYARIMYAAPVAAEVAPALAAEGGSEVELAKALGGNRTGGEETSPLLWDDPLTTSHLARAATQAEHFHQSRLLAEDAAEHLSRALRLGGDPATLSDLLLEARLLDYVGMKNIYAGEIAGFWKDLGANPDPRKLRFYIGEESSSHDHSRIQDMMDSSGDLQLAYRAAWLESYTPYRLGTVMGKWNAEFQYWWRLERRFRDFVAAFHRGDALPPLESLNPGY